MSNNTKKIMVNATTVVAVPCHFCQEVQKIENIPVQGFANWQNGELIQNALPELNTDQRELLISGICPKCWDERIGS